MANPGRYNNFTSGYFENDLIDYLNALADAAAVTSEMEPVNILLTNSAHTLKLTDYPKTREWKITDGLQPPKSTSSSETASVYIQDAFGNPFTQYTAFTTHISTLPSETLERWLQDPRMQKAVEINLEKIMEIDKHGNILFSAVAANDLSCVNTILKIYPNAANQNLYEFDYTLLPSFLLLAIQKDFNATAIALIDAGATLNMTQPLNIKFIFDGLKDDETKERFSKWVAEQTFNDKIRIPFSPLKLALLTNNQAIVEKLIARGATITNEVRDFARVFGRETLLANEVTPPISKLGLFAPDKTVTAPDQVRHPKPK